jgi:hypothetical protein
VQPGERKLRFRLDSGGAQQPYSRVTGPGGRFPEQGALARPGLTPQHCERAGPGQYFGHLPTLCLPADQPSGAL